MDVTCHRHFLPGTSLEPAGDPPPLRLQASHCSTFRIMCDVIDIIIIIIISMDVSCHGSFLPDTSLEPAVNTTAQASSFTLLHTAVLSVLCVMFQV
jgi:hypothetical protein